MRLYEINAILNVNLKDHPVKTRHVVVPALICNLEDVLRNTYGDLRLGSHYKINFQQS